MECADPFLDALSGGQRRLVAVARTQMNDPRRTLTDRLPAGFGSGRDREVVELTAQRVHDHDMVAVTVTRDQQVLDL